MYHSLIINVGDTYIDTWDDWRLIPSSAPVIAPPIERKKFVTVPGRDGCLDYSQSVAKKPTYDDRTGKIEFYLENDYPGWDWETAYVTICETLKGQRVRFALEDNPSHYYEGLLWVNQYKSDKGHSKITLEYELHPTMHTLNVGAVALNTYAVRLNRGMEYQLLIGVGPTNTFYRKVNVTAAPKEIAKITRNGTILALKQGKAVVTAECGGVKAECSVEVGKFDSFTISMTLNGCAASNPVTGVVSGGDYQNVITVADTNSQTLGLTVTMGGTDVTGSCVTMASDGTSGKIKMDQVTGNINITANAAAKQSAQDTPLPVEVAPLQRVAGTFRLGK